MRVLRNAAIPAALLGGDGARCDHFDIFIEAGRIKALATPETGPGHDCRGGLVLPGLVDIHTHLDKGHIWPRRPNPDGTWGGALAATLADRANHWSAADLSRRMDFALRCAYAHGTAAIRTHLDSVPPQHDISWPVFAQLRERWQGRIELQAVALIGPDLMLQPRALDEVARLAAAHGGILGGSVAVFEKSKAALMAVIEKAGDLNLDLDLHIDETLDPAARALEHLAEAVVETGYRGRVLAGHCCALAVQEETDWRRTIDKVARAGLAIVSLPMCNLYLQDRDPAGLCTPRRRGATLVHELRAAGVPVAIASDNTRDPFYAYGDLDAVEVLREGARILHFDHPQGRAWGWVGALAHEAARIAGFAYAAKIEVGAPADLIVCDARNWTELLARPQSDRMVLRAGQAIDTTPPDYRELDDLMEP